MQAQTAGCPEVGINTASVMVSGREQTWRGIPNQMLQKADGSEALHAGN